MYRGGMKYLVHNIKNFLTKTRNVKSIWGNEYFVMHLDEQIIYSAGMLVWLLILVLGSIFGSMALLGIGIATGVKLLSLLSG
jgi:hypothetical protein